MRISIDLWGTLIKGSPLFYQRKIELAKEYFHCTDLYAVYSFTSTKKYLDYIIERTGWQPSVQNIISLLCSYFDPSNIYKDKYHLFYDEYQKIAVSYPPSIYSEETLIYLEKLSIQNKIILSSNTMLLDAHTLEQILNKLGLNKFIHEYHFSSRMGFSKPDPRMYGNSNYHIGDNVMTDIIGADRAGSKGILINSNSATIKDAHKLITSENN